MVVDQVGWLFWKVIECWVCQIGWHCSCGCRFREQEMLLSLQRKRGNRRWRWWEHRESLIWRRCRWASYEGKSNSNRRWMTLVNEWFLSGAGPIELRTACIAPLYLERGEKMNAETHEVLVCFVRWVICTGECLLRESGILLMVRSAKISVAIGVVEGGQFGFLKWDRSVKNTLHRVKNVFWATMV